MLKNTSTKYLPCGTKFLREFILADWLGIILRFSESTQYPAFKLFSFLLSKCNRNTYFQTINQYSIVYCFVSEWKRQLWLNRHDFLVLYLKLENISTLELIFCRKNVCGNFYLRELIFADPWKSCNWNRRNQNPPKFRATRCILLLFYIIKGLVNRSSHDCHFHIDRDVSTAQGIVSIYFVVLFVPP